MSFNWNYVQLPDWRGLSHLNVSRKVVLVLWPLLEATLPGLWNLHRPIIVCLLTQPGSWSAPHGRLVSPLHMRNLAILLLLDWSLTCTTQCWCRTSRRYDTHPHRNWQAWGLNPGCLDSAARAFAPRAPNLRCLKKIGPPISLVNWWYKQNKIAWAHVHLSVFGPYLP